MPASPTTATNPASTLDDVLDCVTYLLIAVNALPAESILRGKVNLVAVDAPPRVLFIPEVKGTWGDPPEGTGGTGYVAGIKHGCDVYVWGEPDVDPARDWFLANALARRVINCIMRAARGRIEGGSFGDPSVASVSKYGEDVRFQFLYNTGVQQDREIWAVPSMPIGYSPPDINKPPGTPNTTILPLNLTVTPQ